MSHWLPQKFRQNERGCRCLNLFFLFFFSLLLTEKNSFNRTVSFWVSSTLIVYLKLYWKYFHWARLFWNIFELNCCPRLSPAVVTFAFLTWFRPRGHVNIHKYDRWMHECMLSRTMEGTKHFHLFTLLSVCVNKVCFATDSGAETWGWVRRFTLQVCFKGACSTKCT